MDRRSVLVSAGSALSLSFSGCLGRTFAGGNETSNRPWTASSTSGAQDGTHHLVVENHTDTTLAAWLRVSKHEGPVIVDGRYELPDGRGIKFAEIAGWEMAYTIELAIDGEETTSLEWTTPTCGPDSEAPGKSGSRNATVLIKDPVGENEEHQISLMLDECDALYGPGLPTGPAATYRLDE